MSASDQRRRRDYGEGHTIESFGGGGDDDDDGGNGRTAARPLVVVSENDENDNDGGSGESMVEPKASDDRMSFLPAEADSNDDTDESSSSVTDSVSAQRSANAKNRTASAAAPSSNLQLRRCPVGLYIPNLMGYLRIALAFYGLHQALEGNPPLAIGIWTASALLDLLDGMAARKFDQCSKLGVLLDIVADNVLRATVWMAVVLEVVRYRRRISGSHGDSIDGGAAALEVCVVVFVMCLEWITMACSQLLALLPPPPPPQESALGGETGGSGGGSHWKEDNAQQSKNQPPWLIRAIFKNGFKSPLGCLAIYGLFCAPMGSYVWYADDRMYMTWPYQLVSEGVMGVLVKLAYVGRLLSVSAELWLCYGYVSRVIAMDERERERKMKVE